MVRIFLITVFLNLTQIFAQEITVQISSDTTSYLIGQRIKLDVKLDYHSDINVAIPQIKDSIPKLEFIKQLSVDSSKQGDKITKIYKYEFTGFDSGDVTIPSIIFPYYRQGSLQPGYLASDSLRITIHTVAVDTSKEIKDVNPPLTMPPDYLLLSLIAVGLIVLLWILYKIVKYLQKRRLGRTTEIPEIMLSPFEEAMEKLKALEAKMLWQEGKIKEYHSEITGIVRGFFEKEYRIPALESTSAELITAMKKSNMGNEIIQISNEFFENADMVKFAKFIPLPVVNETMMKQAYRIIELSKAGNSLGGTPNV